MRSISEREKIKQEAEFITLVCHFSNVSQDRYEQWRDSMSDEYFALHCERIFEEDLQKLLVRLI